VTFSGAFPQNNPSDITTTTLAPLPDGCHYEYHEFIDLIDVEYVEKDCFEVGKCECIDKSESICLTYTEDQSICEPSEEEECKNITKKICELVPKNITVPYETEVPRLVTKKECTNHWVNEKLDNGAVIKKWVADPNNCTEFTITVFDKINRTRTVQSFVNVTTEISVPFCKIIQKNRCQVKPIEREDCTTKVETECKDKVEEKCIDIHKKVPETITKKKAIVTCEDTVLDSGSNNLEEILDVRTSQ